MKLRQLQSELFSDPSNYNTKLGWIEFNGQKMFVRKHWSYEGGYPCYSDQECLNELGELVIDYTTKTHYEIEGVKQYEHGIERPNYAIFDYNLNFMPCMK